MYSLADLTEATVLEETKKIQYLYRLKYEIRYHHERSQDDSTESVAEHIYGMHLLAQYFLPFENPEGTWDKARVYEMITLHDIDEVETGDTIGYLKTPEMRENEKKAMRVVLGKVPEHVHDHWKKLIDDYEDLASDEARFVKALDRFEPLIHLYNEKGRQTMHGNKTELKHSQMLKTAYVAPFPYIKHFSDTLHAAMDREGYFYSGSDLRTQVRG